ncbi:MAG: hypothetical protein LBS20_10945 [Prevotella sp.]|nr:hypothetical protein [Prevotella sp.]
MLKCIGVSLSWCSPSTSGDIVFSCRRAFPGNESGGRYGIKNRRRMASARLFAFTIGDMACIHTRRLSRNWHDSTGIHKAAGVYG